MKKIVLISILLLTGFVFSQDKAQEDIKVGLVLSGGGAKGMAHIGALQIIEDAGVRIDYIGGTSMGAIVGALYASGYSAKQLDSIFRSVDFNDLINDEIPRRAKTFYEKEEHDKYAITLPFDKFKVSLPASISKGQNMYNLFSELTTHVNDIEDFKKLPIPFFCMATNIESGKEVILNKGYLPQAISASGALPTLFSPVSINDSLYIDGGVTNNYPIDEVRAMGADFIIGIDVQNTLKTREDLKTVLDVMAQLSNFQTIENMHEKRLDTDIYIHPNIDDFTVISFTEVDNIINSGSKKAALYKDKLMTLATRQKRSVEKYVKISNSESLFINSVEIEGNVQYSRAYILGKLKLRTPGKTSYKKFSDGVNNLSATGNFQVINYRFIKDETGGLKVKFNLIESETKTLLRLGAHYDDLFKTAALVNVTRKRLFTNNDIVSFDFIIGDNPRYNFNYFIDKGFYWSIGLNSNYSNFDKNVSLDFIGEDLMSSENSELNGINFEYGDLTNQLFLQTVFKRNFVLGAGLEHKWLQYFSKTIGIDENNTSKTTFEDSNYYSTFGYLILDTFDNKYYPTKGFFFKGDFHLYLISAGFNKNFDQFSIAKAKFGFAHSIIKNLSALISSEGGVTIGGNAAESFNFFVGGYGFKESNNLVSFYGYDNLSFRGDTYLKATLTIDYEVFKKTHISMSANIANVGDDLFSTKGWINGIDYTGYALGFGWETFFGPIEAKYSFSPELDNGHWYVNVGYWF